MYPPLPLAPPRKFPPRPPLPLRGLSSPSNKNNYKIVNTFALSSSKVCFLSGFVSVGNNFFHNSKFIAQVLDSFIALIISNSVIKVLPRAF